MGPLCLYSTKSISAELITDFVEAFCVLRQLHSPLVRYLPCQVISEFSTFSRISKIHHQLFKS